MWKDFRKICANLILTDTPQSAPFLTMQVRLTRSTGLALKKLAKLNRRSASNMAEQIILSALASRSK